MKTFLVTLFIAMGIGCLLNGVDLKGEPEKTGISDIAVPGYP
jgi:hypothetical protein